MDRNNQESRQDKIKKAEQDALQRMHDARSKESFTEWLARKQTKGQTNEVKKGGKSKRKKGGKSKKSRKNV